MKREIVVVYCEDLACPVQAKFMEELVEKRRVAVLPKPYLSHGAQEIWDKIGAPAHDRHVFLVAVLDRRGNVIWFEREPVASLVPLVVSLKNAEELI